MPKRTRRPPGSGAAIERLLEDVADDAGRPGKQELADRIEALIQRAIEQERGGAPRSAAQLWLRTGSRVRGAPIEAEARFRSNEARDLADLLESGEELPDGGE